MTDKLVYGVKLNKEEYPIGKDTESKPWEPFHLKDIKPFQKFDSGKPNLTNLGTFLEELGVVDSIIEYGAVKYGRHNWKLGIDESTITRYKNALLRHSFQYGSGEKVDSESNFHHLGHVVCNCLFLMWLEKNLDPEIAKAHAADQ